ncbi:MAG TPA: PIN domain-containing protein [Capillimicrobium sp.]|nr:PIN domain-containing protein [Capillimicrobium sp.]
MTRLLLDTSALIAIERRRVDPADLADLDRDDLAMAAISAAELLVGSELVEPERREAHRAEVERAIAAVDVIPYDLDTARAHASLVVAARRDGRPRQPHDLIIAATARATDRVVVTLDRAGFDGLPGVDVRVPA